MPAIRIRVGASLDGDAANVFVPLIEASKRARKTVSDNLNTTAKAARGVGGAAKKSAKDVNDVEAEFEALKRKVSGLPPIVDVGTAAIKKLGKEAKSSFDEAKRSFNALARDAERNAKAFEKSLSPSADAKANARAAAKRQQGAERVVSRIAMGSAHAATRLGGDLVRGIGVDTDLGSMFGKQVDLETRATDLSNAGYSTDENASAANRTRQDPAAIIAQARQIASETAFDPAAAIAGLQAFVGKTGDLDTGRAILKDMAVLSKATGTNLEDMVNAAGDASNALGDAPNKAERLQQIMRSIAGQGKLGAVEISDMAKQMAKLAANATQIEGDVGGNIALLGAFAQEARQRGGAASATMSATSVASLISTFKTPARIAAFKAATGESVYNKDGMMRSPQELLMSALKARGTDPEGFKAIFANVQGARAVEGFASIYRQTYAGASGSKEERQNAAAAAVTAEFDRLKQAAILQGEVAASFAASMKTTESQVTLFNNQISATAAEASGELMPALKGLAPAAIIAAHGLSNLVTFFAGRAGLEDGKTDVENSLKAGQTNREIRAVLSGAYGKDEGGANVMPAGLVEKAEEQRAALEKAAAEKRANAKDELEGLSAHGLNREGIEVAAKGGDATAQKYMQFEDEAKAASKDAEDLAAQVALLRLAITGGAVKTFVVNHPTPEKPKAPPPARGVPLDADTDQ